MLADIGRLVGHGTLGLFRAFALKDSHGQPRWILSVLLYGVIGALVAFAFLAGVIFRGTSHFETLRDRVRLIAMASPGDPADAWQSGQGDTLDLAWSPIETNHLSLETVSIPLGRFTHRGGGLAEASGHVLFLTPDGRIGTVAGIAGGASDPRIGYSTLQVPMNMAGFEESAIAEMPLFNRTWIRAFDILARPGEAGRTELYASHVRYVDECFTFTVSRIALEISPDGALSPATDWEEFWSARPCIEMKDKGNLFSGLKEGGRMAFGPGERMYVTVGDFDFDGDNSAEALPMRLDNDLGKVIEIEMETGASRPYAVGMRNSQGLTLTDDGHMFTSEHGPNGGDEINSVRRGGNYGWPEVTMGLGYGFPRREWPTNPVQGRHDGYEKPVFAFVPSVAVSGLAELQSPLFPPWRGDLMLATLEDEALWRLRRDGDRILYGERIEMHERLRDIEMLEDGRIALLTDSARLILIRPKSSEPEAARLTVAGYEGVREAVNSFELKRASLNMHEGEALFLARCASCHALDSRENLGGPHLDRLIGRRVGSVEGFPYSDALSGREEIWNERRLRRFLSNPELEFEGTSMPRVSLTYAEYLHLAWYMTNCTGGRDRPQCHRPSD